MTQVRKQSTANRTLTIHCFFDSPLIADSQSLLCWAEIDFNFMVVHGWPQNHRFFFFDENTCSKTGFKEFEILIKIFNQLMTATTFRGNNKNYLAACA